MGAKKKPSSAREPATAASPGKKQRVSAKEAKTVLADMVPKARSAYAIFMSANFERIKESLDSSSGNLLQREVVRECGQAWKRLAAEDRATWQAKADAELQAQKKVLGQLFSDFGPTPSTQPGDSSGSRAPDVVLGDFVLTNDRLWAGSSVRAFRCYHKELHYDAMSVAFDNLADIQHELRILQKILDQGEHFKHELILTVLQPVTYKDAPIRSIIFEHVPRLDVWVQENTPLSGSSLQAPALAGVCGLLACRYQAAGSNRTVCSCPAS